jgi:hypothetical protein
VSDRPLRIYINERPFTVPAGSTVAAALAAFDADLANAAGAMVTDGRGIALALDAPLSGGAILRVLKASRAGD